MLDVLKEILGSSAGSASFVFGILVLCGWVIHYATKFTTRISTRHDQFNERMDKTEANFDRRIDKIESSIDVIKEDIAFLKGSFEAAIGIKDAVTKRKSPISLTDVGLEIANKYNLYAMTDGNWSKISKVLQGLKIKNPYDVQENCIEIAFLKPNWFFSDADIDKLKTVAYTTGFPLFSIARLMGILIRDKYLSENGIDVSEVDQHDPNLVSSSDAIDR